MARKLFGVLDPDGKTIHVLAFSAKFCKDEFVRPVARHDESFDLLWEEAKAEGYRCIELGIASKERNKYQIHDEAPDPWELLMDCEEAQEN
jgi:hypothetical protein